MFENDKYEEITLSRCAFDSLKKVMECDAEDSCVFVVIPFSYSDDFGSKDFGGYGGKVVKTSK